MFTPQDIQDISKQYRDGKNTSQIAQAYRVSSETIRYHLHKSNTPIRPRQERQRLYSVNHEAFNELNPEAFYFAGFLMADGNIRKDKRHWSLEINERDEYLLQELKDFINYAGPIQRRVRKKPNSGTDQTLVALRVTSPQMVKSLSRWGIVPRKSNIAQINPDMVCQQDLERYFFRGLFDGDGCLHVRDSGQAYANFCGSPHIVRLFRDWCWNEIDATGHIDHTRTNDGWQVVQFYSSNAIRLWHLLYDDSSGPRLSRKSDMFKSLVC